MLKKITNNKFALYLIKVNIVIINIVIWTIICYQLHWFRVVNEITNVIVDNIEIILVALISAITTNQIKKRK